MWFLIIAGIAVVIIIVCVKSKNSNSGYVSSESRSQTSQRADRIYPAELPGVKIPKISTTEDMLKNPVIQEAVQRFTRLFMEDFERCESVFWNNIEQSRFALINVSQEGSVNYLRVELHTPGHIPDERVYYSTHNMEEIKYSSVTKK